MHRRGLQVLSKALKRIGLDGSDSHGCPPSAKQTNCVTDAASGLTPESNLKKTASSLFLFYERNQAERLTRENLPPLSGAQRHALCDPEECPAGQEREEVQVADSQQAYDAREEIYHLEFIENNSFYFEAEVLGIDLAPDARLSFSSGSGRSTN